MAAALVSLRRLRTPLAAAAIPRRALVARVRTTTATARHIDACTVRKLGAATLNSMRAATLATRRLTTAGGGRACRSRLATAGGGRAGCSSLATFGAP
jgi:hypothetical protein